MFRDFFWLIFPRHCAVCASALIHSEKLICVMCRYRLPKTNSHLEQNNAVEKLFWGRIPVEHGYAYYRFEKGNSVQQLIYRLKYKGDKEIGQLTGEWMGGELKDAELFQNIDLIIPVPLHAMKKRKRGYNQCDYFARGLGAALNKPVNSTNLVRNRHSSSQTHKFRYDRWENVSTIFMVKQPSLFEQKHILIVDDVITTGATLEAAGRTVLDIPGTKVSIAALAITV